ncbi:SURF1 family protein [Candidimonas sp. SYP-B2681]|uniref:SURF1 family protein n=1 Tax=Candidimonas sp. SYP-B2681 TaxID=2497686 RepID=UPI000F88E987|nr:SURF1 family protein [Candidimonas sp. SYP-B2681]RTZ45442.1 SURF1 family protein [Candidimonas sp. SYP-B2681]
MARSHTPHRTLLALILLGLMEIAFLSLGNWQLDRAAQRESIKAAIDTGRSTPPLRLQSDTAAKHLVPWRPAIAHGVWLHKFTVLLENRNYQGRPGYWVATPLLIDQGANTAVLVLRGWLPRPMRPNEALADVPAPAGEQTINGELLERVPRLFELWSWSDKGATELPATLPDPAKPLPKLQNLDLSDYGRATGLTLVPAVLAEQAVGAGPSGATSKPGQLLQEWPEPSLDADKNRGYALQWFGFATIAAGAWLVIAWRALRRKNQSKTL